VPDVLPRRLLGREARRALDDFQFFRRRYFGRVSTPWQEEAAYRMVELLATGDKEYVVVNCPPGVGKSTLFTHDIPCWVAVRDRSVRCMIGSRTEKQARMYTARLRRTFDRTRPVVADSELVARGLAFNADTALALDFGRFKPLNNDLWRLEEFVLAQPKGVAVEDKESSFVAYGMDSGFLGGRYDLIVWDDLVDKRTLRTEDARDALVAWWETEAETRLEPGGLLILQGQRMGSKDLYRYALDLREMLGDDPDDPTAAERRKYHHIVYKAHFDDRCRQQHRKDNPPYPKGCLLDPVRLPWRELQRVQANKLERYAVLYQQEDTDPTGVLVPPLYITGGLGADGVAHPGCLDDDRPVGRIPKGLAGDWYSVVTADPSPTKSWAVQWWYYQADSGLQLLIDLFRGPMEAPDFLDWNQHAGLFTGLLDEWWHTSHDQGAPITHVIVEANAAQRFLLQYDHVRRWSTLRSVNIVPHATHRNKSDPEYGVQTLAPHYRHGRVRLPNHPLSQAAVRPLVREVTTYPHGGTDDQVMAHWFLIWQAPHLLPPKPATPPTFTRPSWLANSRRRLALA